MKNGESDRRKLQSTLSYAKVDIVEQSEHKDERSEKAKRDGPYLMRGEIKVTMSKRRLMTMRVCKGSLQSA